MAANPGGSICVPSRRISRNAVNQHLSSLSGSGFIQTATLASTGGRQAEQNLFVITKWFRTFSKTLLILCQAAAFVGR